MLKMTKTKFLYNCFRIPIFGNRLKGYILKKSGTQQESILLREYTKEMHSVDVGLYTYGGCFEPDFALGGSVKIGQYCSIASNVHYFGDTHPIEYVSTSPYFYNTHFNGGRREVKHPKRGNLEIGNDCWIGYGTIILNSCCKIGNGAIVGAGAVITKDVPPYAIVAGSPAKILRYRFDKETIALLEDSKWWEKTPEEVLLVYEYINLPKEFVEHIAK